MEKKFQIKTTVKTLDLDGKSVSDKSIEKIQEGFEEAFSGLSEHFSLDAESLSTIQQDGLKVVVKGKTVIIEGLPDSVEVNEQSVYQADNSEDLVEIARGYFKGNAELLGLKDEYEAAQAALDSAEKYTYLQLAWAEELLKEVEK